VAIILLPITASILQFKERGTPVLVDPKTFRPIGEGIEENFKYFMLDYGYPVKPSVFNQF